MGLKFNSRTVGIFPTAQYKSLKNEFKSPGLEKEKKCAKANNNYLDKIEFSSNKILSNYTRTDNFKSFIDYKNIPNGHSRYDYKGARFDIYRNNDEYKSQFVYPHAFDMDEFIDEFPNLENQPIIKSHTTGSSIESINGEIDETVSQSSQTGDCWLISSLVSLSQNEKGREIIKNSITVNDNNTVTVSFKGIGVSYTLSEYEISKYDTDSITSDSYSNGDNDVLVMELAVEKLWKDIEKGNVKLNTNNENITYTGEGYGIEDGGLPSQMIYYLTGVESNEYYNNDLSALSKSKIYEILDNALSTNSVINIGIYNEIHSCKLTDGSTYSIDTSSGGHALAVVDITSDTVTFVNPWDTSVKYTASWEEFASLGIGYISASDLSKSYEKEVVDMSNDETYSDYNFNQYFDYDYRRGNRNYGFDFDNSMRPDNIPEIDFDVDNNELRPSYDNDENSLPNSKYDFNQTSIVDLLFKFFDILDSMLSMLRI